MNGETDDYSSTRENTPDANEEADGWLEVDPKKRATHVRKMVCVHHSCLYLWYSLFGFSKEMCFLFNESIIFDY